jgi:glutaredoxin
MSFIRAVLSSCLILWDQLFPAPAPSSPIATRKDTQGFAIYEFRGCPFCIKVRRGLRRVGIEVEYREAKDGSTYREELIREGGMLQVPCLRIEESLGKVQWLYESEDILNYLKKRFERTPSS